MKRKWMMMLLALSLLAVGVSACKGAETAPSAQDVAGGEKETEKPPEEEPEQEEAAISLFGEFATDALDGEAVDQSVFSEYELTMVNIWGTFCSPCIREMPDLAKLNEIYKEQGVQVVGVVADVFAADGSIAEEQLDTAKEIVEKTGANYTHIVPNLDMFADRLQEVTSLPTTVFVDKDGNVVGKAYLGARDEKKWAEIIDEKLEEVKKADETAE